MKKVFMRDLKQGDVFAFNLGFKWVKTYEVERRVHDVLYCKDNMGLIALFDLRGIENKVVLLVTNISTASN